MSFITNLGQKISSNWKSGVTVSLVSIPLSVSLAVASGTTPTVGIITAVWAGLMAALFGGSNYNVVGPTGALSGLLAVYAASNGADALPMLAIVSGVMILASWVFKLERYLVFVPASTVHGFTLGVAFIIAFNQLNYIFGLDGLPKHETFMNNTIESLRHIWSGSLSSFVLFALFLIGLFVLLKVMPKLPGAITLTPIGILVGYLGTIGKIPFHFQTLGEKFSDIRPIIMETPRIFFDSSLIKAGVAVALIAILETMISAKIADGLTDTKHNKNKEMRGLGIANIVSGIFGGIPATAALARTALNIKAGANHRTSSGMSAVCIVLISLIFLKYFTFIPLAVIAAILVFVAVRMVESGHFLRMYRFDKKGLVLALIVAGVTVFEDPIIGILFGTSVSLILFVEKLSKGQFELIINDANRKMVGKMSGEEIDAVNLDKSFHTMIYSIKGQLAYINAQAHLSRFEDKLPEYSFIILRLRELYFIDMDGIDVFDEIVDLIESRGKKVLITGASPLLAEEMAESNAFMRLKAGGFVFERTRDALKYLGF
jgi:SulP family sulfate permease